LRRSGTGNFEREGKRMKKLGYLMWAIAFVPALTSCYSGRIAENKLRTAEVEAAFRSFKVEGVGPDFLTVRIDTPGKNFGEAEDRFFVQILDPAEEPLRHVTGFVVKSEQEGKPCLLAYSVLFDPREDPGREIRSEFIQLIWGKGKLVQLRLRLPLKKVWGEAEGEETAIRPPLPPDRISGSLALGDYTFLAAGDIRATEGFYVEGAIVGNGGRWTRFDPSSDNILGNEQPPQQVLQITRGWLELETGKTHAMQEAISPSPPYINGWWDRDGHFYPEPVRIYR
jgi:hypothetical protein